MLRSARNIISWAAVARGGPVGVVRDFLVDDRQWTVRHLTVETSKLAHERHALVSPRAVKRLDEERKRFELSLEQWEVAAAPDIEYDPPIAVQQEQSSYDVFGWRYYWQRPAGSIEGKPTATTSPPAAPLSHRTRAHLEADPHLRSVVVMTGYRVIGPDEEIGVIEDFVLDDETWQIGCLVVRNADTKIAVRVRHITAIDWPASEMLTDLGKAQVAVVEPYDADSPSCRGLAA